MTSNNYKRLLAWGGGCAAVGVGLEYTIIAPAGELQVWTLHQSDKPRFLQGAYSSNAHQVSKAVNHCLRRQLAFPIQLRSLQPSMRAPPQTSEVTCLDDPLCRATQNPMTNETSKAIMGFNCGHTGSKWAA